MARIRPDRKADSRQMAERRAELHDLADRICDAWPEVQKQATEMVRGFPSSSLAGGGSGGSSDSVVERALEQYDPAQDAQDALTEFDSLLYTARFVAKQFTRLTVPALQKPAGDAATTCDRCKRLISGTVESDPNLSGFCSDCFNSWVELGRPDRGDFVKMKNCAECGKVAIRSEQPDWFDGNSVHHRSLKPACYQSAYRRVKRSA